VAARGLRRGASARQAGLELGESPERLRQTIDVELLDLG
jgi:hypothetical protein